MNTAFRTVKMVYQTHTFSFIWNAVTATCGSAVSGSADIRGRLGCVNKPHYG